MRAMYKQRCIKCKKNWVVVSSGQRYAVCYECQKPSLDCKIKDPKMKKMFNLPEEYYIKNSFLRDIKINYLRYGKLTEKQVEAFKKAVEKLKDEGLNNSAK
jgi:hypothetical protein